MPSLSRAAALAVGSTTLLVCSLPAQAQGGSGGGGGGADQASVPSTTSGACVRLAALTPSDTVLLKNAAKAHLRFEVTSCSSSPETVSLSFTRTWTPVGQPEAPCTGGPLQDLAGAALTLRPGDRTAFDLQVPGSGCAYGTGGATSDVTGLATATSALGRATATGTAVVVYRVGF